MDVKNKIFLKESGFYHRFQKPISRLHSWALRITNKRKFYWMKKQSLMIDPCTQKRQKYWVKCGAKIEGQINIGYDVYFDASNARCITIEDKVWIASRCLILCHKRDMSNYCVGDDYNKLPYHHKEVVLKRGCTIGMGSIIMPGVTIGEGAMIGAGSVVTHDIPAWTIAVGNPAKVVKEIKPRTQKIELEHEQANI